MKRASPTLTEEEKVWRRGDALIGVDEVGMGPLAGPVMAVALMFDARKKEDIDDIVKLGVKDSKAVTPKKRERIFETLTAHPAVRWAAGEVGWRTIDRINVLEAGLLAMRKAVDRLFETERMPGAEKVFVYVDGRNIVPDLTLNQKSVIDGDTKIFSVACASIIAKVLRDRLMCEYAKKYPEYSFEKHKGYGTKLHFALIKQHGPSPIHRKSFLKWTVGS